jgi:hypothetical protein
MPRFDEDVWTGGNYELFLWWRSARPERALRAFRALWSRSELEPRVVGDRATLDEGSPVGPAGLAFEPTQEHPQVHVYGYATLPGGTRVPCGSFCTAHGEGAETDGWTGEMWVDVYVTTSALGHAYPVGAFPFEDEHDSGGWRPELDSWLVEIARSVYAAEPFDVGLVGFEVQFDGEPHYRELVQATPEERWDGLLLPRGGALEWHPPTTYAAQLGFGDAS